MLGLERRGVLGLSIVKGELFLEQDLRYQGIKTETGTEDKEKGVFGLRLFMISYIRRISRGHA
jgi:hypothetical protein